MKQNYDDSEFEIIDLDLESSFTKNPVDNGEGFGKIREDNVKQQEAEAEFCEGATEAEFHEEVAEDYETSTEKVEQFKVSGNNGEGTEDYEFPDESAVCGEDVAYYEEPSENDEGAEYHGEPSENYDEGAEYYEELSENYDEGAEYYEGPSENYDENTAYYEESSENCDENTEYYGEPSEGYDEESWEWFEETAQDKKSPVIDFLIKHRNTLAHVTLLSLVVVFIFVLVYKFLNWGEFISQEEIFRDGKGTYEDIMDNIVPLVDEEGHMVSTNYDDGLNIVLFGNAPFADDRDSEDGLANMIAKEANATVYNCAVSGSFLVAQQPNFNAEVFPMDAYNFYWLTALAINAGTEFMYEEAEAALGDKLPPDAKEAYHTLTSIDFDTVDVIVVMYDAADYFASHAMFEDANPTNIMTFTGNMEAGIELLQRTYPHIRIIVLSPPYAFGIDEDGEYISSDIKRYGHDVLSTYVIKQYGSCFTRSVTFVDNIYGTITEDNAREYLTDNVHLNVAGRKKILERFLYALHYYD